MKATYFVRLAFRFEEINMDEMVAYLKERGEKVPYLSVATSFLSGETSGIHWVEHLEAEEGKEDYEVDKFRDKAHEVAIRLGLKVNGPHCNVEWH